MARPIGRAILVNNNHIVVVWRLIQAMSIQRCTLWLVTNRQPSYEGRRFLVQDLPGFTAVAADIGTTRTVVSHVRPAWRPTDSGRRILFKSRGLQVSEVSGCQHWSIMTDNTVYTFSADMPIMFAWIPAVVLRSAFLMTGATLRVDIERTGRPGRRGLPTVTAGVGAGTAVKARRTAA